MDNYVWYVLIRTENGKHYAHAFRLRQNQNIASFVHDYPNITHMNACPTMKYAKEIAQAWNESFKKNGTYMFDDENYQC